MLALLRNFIVDHRATVLSAFGVIAMLSFFSGSGYIHAEEGDLTKIALTEMLVQYLSSFMTLALILSVLKKSTGSYAPLGHVRGFFCFLKGSVNLVFLVLLFFIPLAFYADQANMTVAEITPGQANIIAMVTGLLMSILYATMAFATRRHALNAELRKLFKRQAAKQADFTFFMKVPWLSLVSALKSPVTILLAALSVGANMSATYSFANELPFLGALLEGTSSIVFGFLFYAAFNIEVSRERTELAV